MPLLSVIAGPNGSGKSTLTSSVWFEGTANLIDPDAIARRLNAIQSSAAAIPAGREAIVRCNAIDIDVLALISADRISSIWRNGGTRESLFPEAYTYF